MWGWVLRNYFDKKDEPFGGEFTMEITNEQRSDTLEQLSKKYILTCTCTHTHAYTWTHIYICKVAPEYIYAQEACDAGD